MEAQSCAWQGERPSPSPSKDALATVASLGAFGYTTEADAMEAAKARKRVLRSPPTVVSATHTHAARIDELCKQIRQRACNNRSHERMPRPPPL